ncbi:amyloid-beta A4 precursor protein-binding family A member 1 [Limanda limanda]|uniref:amyloid-beta A4 precursor protein-binding family A member 1 n=1 Tax=Limanda limanda TaxID=27771 RepID=UPI0029C6290A|nr:amyloid-beta A4 precursor protein-binding family A member 1 [Limanda limanda]
MSHKYQGEEPEEEPGEEHKAPPRSRQPNGTPRGEPAPPRRSWRPCQMLHQDGEPNPLHHHHPHEHHNPHHHHPAAGRGTARHRRRPGEGPAQSPDQVSEVTSSRPDAGESRGGDPLPAPPLRPAVARYRRMGDPNPRLRGQTPRQPIREQQDSSHGEGEREGPAEVQQRSADEAVTDQSQDRASPHLAPVAVVTPAHLSPAPAASNEQPHPPHAPHAAAEEDQRAACEEEVEEVKEKEQEEAEEDGDCCPATGTSVSGQAVVGGAEESVAARVEEDQEEAAEDAAAQGSEITDLCSDTESAASLSMDGPLHSPPPLQSPTPPSSPDLPPFPQMDHFSEDASMSPVPDHDHDHDLLPEDEDEDCSESCSLSRSTSCSESYPKTYAEFYSESHQKSYPEPESYAEQNSHPNSFPEPLMTSYPELPREPCRASNRRGGRHEAREESSREAFTSHREERVSPTSPTRGSHHVPRQVRDRRAHHPPLDRSVGCRLHHYDGQSDGEGDSGRQSPIPKPHRRAARQTEARENKSPSSGHSSSAEALEPLGVGGAGPGDAISLAIKDIKEAIEEVKTKTVRSPYTPDQPVEPIWVMRQEVSPTEEVYSLQNATGRSPSQSEPESPSCYASGPMREQLSPRRPESSRSLPPPQHYHQQHNPPHHLQQRDATARPPPQTYTQAPPHALTAPGQQRQLQTLPPPQPRPQAEPQSPLQQPSAEEIRRSLPSFPTFVDVLGPCDPEDLIDGIIFAATYLGCTHLLSERTPTKSARMQQAQEAMSRVRAAQKQAKNRKKSPDAEAPSTAEVDLFMSTQRIKVLNADTQESLMDLPLRTISYIADIGNMVVLMARGKMVRSRSAQDNLDHAAEQTTMSPDDRRLYRMICHVFESEDAQLIAQSIGQSFSVAYQEFLRANGIDPEDLSQREYSDLLNTQDMYNDDLIHFSKSENCRDVYIEKQKGEILGVVIVESGWGSILPTVIIASMMHAGPAEKSGRLNIGDQIMTINGTSLVGLPLSTCQSIIKGLKSQSRIKMNIVRCPPVTMVLIRRPDLRYQLGFSVQNGIICSLMRGGIAERGGVRVGHRIIEINSQSVVATPHEKIVQILSNAMGEIHMKTMPAAMYRLLTAQEQPVYI